MLFMIGFIMYVFHPADDAAAIRLAESVGFARTGEIAAGEVVLRMHS